MLVYLRDGSAQTILRAATLRQVACQTFNLTQSQYTDTRPTSPSADPIIPGAWQGRHWSANLEVAGMTRLGQILLQAGFEPQIFGCQGRCLNHSANEAVCRAGLPTPSWCCGSLVTSRPQTTGTARLWGL